MSTGSVSPAEDAAAAGSHERRPRAASDQRRQAACHVPAAPPARTISGSSTKTVNGIAADRVYIRASWHGWPGKPGAGGNLTPCRRRPSAFMDAAQGAPFSERGPSSDGGRLPWAAGQATARRDASYACSLLRAIETLRLRSCPPGSRYTRRGCRLSRRRGPAGAAFARRGSLLPSSPRWATAGGAIRCPDTP